MPHRPTPTFGFSAKTLAGISGLILLAIFFSVGRPIDLNADARSAQKIAEAVLKAQGVHLKSDLLVEQAVQLRRGKTRWNFLEQRYKVRSGFRTENFHAALWKNIKPHRLEVLKSERVRKGNGWVFKAEVGRPDILLYRVVLTEPPASALPASSMQVPVRAPPSPVLSGVSPEIPRGTGKIAIILDDWGYSMRQIPALDAIRQPLTVSVLPGLPHSADVAKAAKGAGHEVMLHLPMEPLNSNAPREVRMISAGMPKKEILRVIESSLASVPYVSGINNHQGSKATSDRELMRVVLGEVKKRGLFFVDSVVTDRTVCAEIAKGMKIKFAKRAVFLDNEGDPEAIRAQLLRAAAEASKRGKAIAIGHDRPATLKVLGSVLPDLEKAGYRVVTASELTDLQGE